MDYAKFTGALVESEPHYFGGSSNLHKEKIDYEEIKKTFSTPEGSLDFVVRTGVDTYAAAVGNLHGKYRCPRSSTWNCCSASATCSPATSACTAAAVRPATTL
ncbi:MAG: class II fructose-bisphosphate aldolase [Candidatus Saccharibacteria bacterium]